ncbi:CTP synthase [Eubacteriales bacterium OttesenSCG-928-M02]|nr:CTP synthase [Eubacteriales bacterium OttesenSCG-928-M02]
MKTKYIFVTGGVVSSLGKGVTGASLGRLLKARGYSIAMMKFDPYINVDPGTMNPFQHGEVFVTESGLETDLDLGHYERFADVSLGKGHNITTGRIYSDLIEKERQGVFMGGTLQTIPHVTGAIKDAIFHVAKKDEPDFLIVEIGGTVGDIEGLPFLEAIAQMPRDVGRKNCFYIHVTLVPYLKSAGELKTKPTQHSVLRELGSVGIQPDALVCRCEQPLDQAIKDKIAFLCSLNPTSIIENQDTSTIYEVPLTLEKEGLPKLVLAHMDLPNPAPDLAEWEEMVHRMTHPEKEVTIAVVGKYVGLKDAYFSVGEALYHGGAHHRAQVDVKWVESEEITPENVGTMLRGVDGILVPGGFGERGVEGMITAIQYARERGIPFFGICLGMQLSVVEYARHEKNMPLAHSTEMDKTTPHPVICLMEEQYGVTQMGGTMRLGPYDCEITPGSMAEEIYGTGHIVERHRHRYEVNPVYLDKVTDDDFMAVGFNPQTELCEMVELKKHPFYMGVQFHPEFKSRPNRPHPMFRAFVGAAIERHEE